MLGQVQGASWALTRLARQGSPTWPCHGWELPCWFLAPFLWVLVCMRFCLCPLWLKSLFPSFLWKFYNQILLAFKIRFPGDSKCLCQIPRPRNLTWGLEPSQQWENFFATICLQFLGHPPGRYGNLILLLLCPSYHLSMASSVSLDVSYLFWWVPAFTCRWLFNS